MFQKNVVEDIKIHMLCSFFSRTSCRLCDNVIRYSRAKQAADDSIMRHRNDAICMPNPKATDIHS